MTSPGKLPTLPDITVDGDWNFGIEVEASWSDVDALGHVTNIAFWRWCDDARVQYAIAVGLDVPAPDTPSFVVVKATGAFHAGLSYLDRGIMTCRTIRIGRSSLTTQHALWSAKGCAFAADFTIVLADQATQKSVPLPDRVREGIMSVDGSCLDR